MKISKIPGLGRFGHYIDDLDLNTVSDEQWHEIGQLHLKGLVTVIRGAGNEAVGTRGGDAFERHEVFTSGSLRRQRGRIFTNEGIEPCRPRTA